MIIYVNKTILTIVNWNIFLFSKCWRYREPFQTKIYWRGYLIILDSDNFCTQNKSYIYGSYLLCNFAVSSNVERK